ncbi:MAG: hypothetical protein U0289_05590 [Cyclobacteriaceae bacterium]|jgi:Tol biopolymer transport system component
MTVLHPIRLTFALVLLFTGARAQQPEIFLPGLVSTGLNERDMAIAPDGKEMYYSIQSQRAGVSVIVQRTWNGKGWGEARVADFSGQFEDVEPAFHPDGSRLYFVSNRPISSGRPSKDYNIWYVDIKRPGPVTAVYAGDEINSIADEYYPSVARDGSVYFTAARPDARGKEDLYRSKWVNNKFESPVNLGDSINSSLDEFNAFVDPDQRYIILGIENGPGDQGRGDLYISYHQPSGSWSKPVNLGPKINSSRLDYCPFVFDGYLYFTRERPVEFPHKEKTDLNQVRNFLESWGNGSGDIYRIKSEGLIEQNRRTH